MQGHKPEPEKTTPPTESSDDTEADDTQVGI